MFQFNSEWVHKLVKWKESMYSHKDLDKLEILTFQETDKRTVRKVIRPRNIEESSHSAEFDLCSLDDYEHAELVGDAVKDCLNEGSILMIDNKRHKVDKHTVRTVIIIHHLN